MIKKILGALICALFVLPMSAAGPEELTPAPVSYIIKDGKLSGGRERIRKNGRFRKEVANLPEWAQKEAYRITVKRKKVVIEALTDEGVFRAHQTLRQLRLLGGSIPCCTILDYPRFRHRGLMIDESRSFKGLDFLKKEMDAMALLKLNVLHLHLDDSAGWRIESAAYPDLTAKTAWRIGRTYHEWEAAKYKFSTADDPEAYGGCYSADDLREIVDYAAKRYITVIPEIEMPGHSMEVGYAYPEVLCVQENGETFRGAWDVCPGSEATFELLETVLGEVMDIFPSPFIHIGGDEATMKTWPLCVNCRKRMEEEGLDDYHMLQGYLVRRIDEFVRSRGRRIIGWDEILETGVPEQAVVQSWRGMEGGLKASQAGHDVVLSPTNFCYFDYYQDLIRKEPKAVGPLVSLRLCYSFEPIAPGMVEDHVLGLQANLWCELIPTVEHAEYMIYPRLYAIAETGWSNHKDYESFRPRAEKLCELWHRLGYNTFDLSTESELSRSGARTWEEFEALKQQN